MVAKTKQRTEQTHSETFIREHFHVIEQEGRTLTATGMYWNQGVCGIAVALCFEADPDEGVYAWKAYIGATVAPAGAGPLHVADGGMTDAEATLFVRRYGVKLHEHEARALLERFDDILGTMRYWH